jgi:predicted RNase H-like HicB family nuclease
MTRYPIEVFWSEEDEGYIAIAPDLPGSSAWGKSEADAITELRTAIDLWIKAAKKAGNPIPKPSDRADVNYSGKFLMRVPKRLHAALARAAKTQGVSLNQYVLYLLTREHGDRGKRAA